MCWLFIFKIKQPHKQQRHELILSSPCLLLCILLSRESHFKRLMSVWYFVVILRSLKKVA